MAHTASRMSYMTIDALALRVKKIASGKGIQSKIKMLIFYYALRASNLLTLAAYALGMIKVMDFKIFNELSIDIGLPAVIQTDIIIMPLQNDIHIKNEDENENENENKNEIKNETKNENET